MNFDVKDISVVLVDDDLSADSRMFSQSFFTSGYFVHKFTAKSNKEAQEILDNGKVKMVLYIPKYFSAKILANENIDIQILVDGVDANTGTTIVGFAQAVTQQYNQKLN